MTGRDHAGDEHTDRLCRVTDREVPGIAVAIAGPEGIREIAAAGYADLAAREPASADMVCPWFSMTKIVTASLAMRLAGRGQLNLDEPVLPLVPDLAVLRPRDGSRRVTCSLTAPGFANPIPVRWIHPAGQPGPDQAALLTRLLARRKTLRFEPGTRSAYSNLSTLVLGQAIASAAGMPYTSLASGEILALLGMRMTGFAYTPGMLARAATVYHPRRSPMRLLLPRWVTGIRSAAGVSFRRFLLDGAAYGGLLGPVRDAAPLPADAPARRRVRRHPHPARRIRRRHAAYHRDRETIRPRPRHPTGAPCQAAWGTLLRDFPRAACSSWSTRWARQWWSWPMSLLATRRRAASWLSAAARRGS
jgi:CubicO group peptidase (beta-lactamase class C family)